MEVSSLLTGCSATATYNFVGGGNGPVLSCPILCICFDVAWFSHIPTPVEKPYLPSCPQLPCMPDLRRGGHRCMNGTCRNLPLACTPDENPFRPYSQRFEFVCNLGEGTEGSIDVGLWMLGYSSSLFPRAYIMVTEWIMRATTQPGFVTLQVPSGRSGSAWTRRQAAWWP